MGDPNYITPAGAKRLSEELGRLRSVERPKVVQEVQDAAAQGDRSEYAEYKYGKLRLRDIDRRMRFLSKRLEAAQVVDPAKQRGDKIFFGAKVVVEDEDGKSQELMIVGVDEVGFEEGQISRRSPVVRALLGKSIGDTVVVRRPAGDAELEIVDVRYG